MGKRWDHAKRWESAVGERTSPLAGIMQSSGRAALVPQWESAVGKLFDTRSFAPVGERSMEMRGKVFVPVKAL